MAQVNGRRGEVKPRWARRASTPARHKLTSAQWIQRTRDLKRAAAQLRLGDRMPEDRAREFSRERWRPERRGTCPACRRGNFTAAKDHCGRRDCPGYIDIWLGDQQVRFFENFLAYDAPIAMTTITAPSLPWDHAWCRPLGDHKCAGPLGCRVEPEVAKAYNTGAFERFRDLHKQAYQATYREFGPGALRRLGYSPELQSRGVVHWHVALGFDWQHRAAARFYVCELHDRARDHWYGFVDRKLEPAPPGKAAWYLSKYMTKAHNAKGGVRELIIRGEAPARPVAVDRRLTATTRCTMRNLRRRRYAYLKCGQRLSMHEIETVWKVFETFPGAQLLGAAAETPHAAP